MGFLRIWLAAMVLASHNNMLPFSGTLAVECFFAISGFYMQMIILENYAHGNNWILRFYKSRFLRIFIPYWIVLIIVIVMTPLAQHYDGFPTAKLLIGWDSMALNFLIFFTDQAKLLRSLADGHAGGLFDRLLVPVVWSVGMELIFYLLSPFLLTRLWAIFSITITAVIAKLLFIGQNLQSFPQFAFWDALLNGIIIFEIGIFTAGALAYRFYANFVKGNGANNWTRYYPQLVMVVLCFTFLWQIIFHLPDAQMVVAYHVFLAAFICVLPYIFSISHQNRFDGSIGELSYSFYLSHRYILLWVIQLGMDPNSTLVSALVLTLIFSYVMVWKIEMPLTAFRHRKFRDTN